MIITIPFCLADGVQAEHMIDFIGNLNQKEKLGHCVLVVAPDVHGEMEKKVTISAEVVFETVDKIKIGWKEGGNNSKVEQINHLFFSAARQMAMRYRVPYLWLEPDCVPLVQGWEKLISAAYQSQPKRYLGSRMIDSQQRSSLSRVSVYPADCINDLGRFLEATSGFEIAAGDVIWPCANKTTLLQQMVIQPNTDQSKIRPDAALLHGDKQGILISLMRERLFGVKELQMNLESVFKAPPEIAGV